MRVYSYTHVKQDCPIAVQFLLVISFLCFLSVLCVPSSYALTVWVNGSGNWDDSTHWSNGIPTASTDVRIWGDLANPPTVTISGDAAAKLEDIKSSSIHQTSGDHNVAELWLDNDTNGVASSYVMDGGTINANRASEGYIRIESRGTFTQNSGSVTGAIGVYYGEYRLMDGILSGSTLSLLNNNNSIFTQAGGTATFQNFTGNGVYNLTSGDFTANGFATVGSSRKTGIFNQSAGTSFHVGYDLRVGTYGWGEGGGTYNLADGTLTVGRDLYVGDYERGDFHQRGGSNLVNGGLYIGGWFKAAIPQSSDMDSRGNGYYSLDGDGILAVGGDEQIGYAEGVGSFQQNSGTHTVAGSFYIGHDPGSVGSYELNDGTLSVNDLHLGGSYDGRAHFYQNGGTLNGCATFGGIFIDGGQGEASYYLNEGTVNVTNMSIQRGTFLQKNGVASIDNSLQIRSNASYEMTGGVLSTNRISTASTGFLSFSNGASIRTGTLLNSGYLQGDGVGSVLTSDNYIINSGGVIAFDNGASIVTDQLNNYSGIISGNGTISGNVLNGGSIYVGGGLGNETAGSLTINGNLSPYWSGAESEFYFYLDGYSQGDDYDFLHILGDAQLNGTLIVSLSSDFNPLSGSIFNLLTVDGTLSGAFNRIELPTFTDGRYFELGYNEHNVYISILGEGTPEPVPEPATFILLGSGLAGLIFCRRMRR